MKLKLKNGGVIKLQNGANVISNKWPINTSWKPIDSFTVSKTPWERIRDRMQEEWNRLKITTKRPKNIGVFDFAYKSPTIMVENGGNLS